MSKKSIVLILVCSSIVLCTMHSYSATNTGILEYHTINDKDVVSVDIAVDTHDYLHFAYVTTDGQLYYAFYDGISYHNELVFSFTRNEVHPVSNVSMALDSSDNPHISCGGIPAGSNVYGKLRYFYYNGSWNQVQFNTWSPEYTAIDLDNDDKVHIIYDYYSDMIHKYQDGSGGWTEEKINTFSSGECHGLDFKIDKQSNTRYGAYIKFNASINDFSPYTWSSNGGEKQVGGYAEPDSISLDLLPGSNRARIVYYGSHASENKLYYCYSNSNSRYVLGVPPHHGHFARIAHSNNGYYIAYQSNDHGRLSISKSKNGYFAYLNPDEYFDFSFGSVNAAVCDSNDTFHMITKSTSNTVIHVYSTEQAPQLHYAGEGLYESSALAPLMGKNTTPYIFKIRYSDEDTDPPRVPPLIRIFNSNGSVTKTAYMNFVSGDWISGALYSCEVALPVHDVYHATISVADQWCEVSNTVEQSGPDVGYEFSGTIYYPDGLTPFPSATVTIQGPENRVVVSDSNGCYGNLIGTYNTDWALSVSSFPGVGSTLFSPTTIQYNRLSEEKIQNFQRIAGHPEMTWIGEPGYIADGVEPSMGASTTTYMFKIKYRDTENDPPKPGYPKVRIKKGGTSINVISMEYMSGDWTSGSVYSASALLAPCSYYTYSFEAYDTWDSSSAFFIEGEGPEVRAFIVGEALFPDGSPMGSVAMTLSYNFTQDRLFTDNNGLSLHAMYPTGNIYTLTPSSYSYYVFNPSSMSLNPLRDDTTCQFVRLNRSSITWAGEPRYIDDGIEPHIDIYGGVTFTYKCKYIDQDNDPPAHGYPHLRILQAGTTVYDVSMNETDPSDTNYRDGKIYYYQTSLPSARDYSYYFVAQDRFGLASRTETKPGPVVALHEPVLSYIGIPGYEDDAVEPGTALPGTTFYFYVMYSDADNDPPKTGYPKLHINVQGGSEVAASPFTMSPVLENPADFVSGVTYYYALSYLSGSHNFVHSIDVYDQHNKFNLMPYMDGPYLNTRAEISWMGDRERKEGAVFPLQGTSDDIYTFSICYSDADNNPPETGYPRLHVFSSEIEIQGSPFAMHYINGEYVTGALYEYVSSLSTGIAYTYSIECYDSMHDPTNSLTGYGPDVLSRISGFVKDPYGMGINGLELVLSGVECDISKTRDTGYFEFLVSSEAYSLAISTSSSYVFDPHSYSFSDITSAVTDFNFTRMSRSPLLTPVTNTAYENKAVSQKRYYPHEPIIFKINYRDPDHDAIQHVPILSILHEGTTIQTLLMIQEEDTGKDGIIFSTSTMVHSIGTYGYTINGSDIYGAYANTVTGTFEVYTEPPPAPRASSLTRAQNEKVVVSGKVFLAWDLIDELVSGKQVIYILYLSGNQNDTVPFSVQARDSRYVVYTGTTPYYTITNLESGKAYTWQVEAVDQYGARAVSSVYSFSTLAKSDNTHVFNYPNPFNPAVGQNTNIVFFMEEAGSAEINIFSEFGDKCWGGQYTNLSQGTHEVVYKGTDDTGRTMYNGTYVCIVTKKYAIREERDFCRILIIK